MMNWGPDMVRFMKDACEYGTYNQELAVLIGPKLRPDCHVCDAGCGLGYLSLELSKFAGHVTAVDINPGALRVLERNCKTYDHKNISIFCRDITQLLPKKPYDAMVFCFFGRIHEVLRIAKAQCIGDIFMISRNYPFHRFSVGTHPIRYGGHQETCEALRRLGIAFAHEERLLDFSQPFASLDDVRRFFHLYSRDNDASLITDAFLLSKVQKTKRIDFPYIMLHKRALGIVHFRAEDISL